MSIESQGTKLYWSTSTAASTLHEIGEVKSFSGPSGSANVMDMTVLTSTAKEKRMGLPDEGQITLDCNLMTSAAGGQQLMRADRTARVARGFIIQLNDATTSRVRGVAYCTGFSISGSVDDVVKASITLEITGGLTWTTA